MTNQTKDLEALANGKTRNPWHEDSDYGKLWRRGYQAGRSDAFAKVVPAIEAILRSHSSTLEGGE